MALPDNAVKFYKVNSAPKSGFAKNAIYLEPNGDYVNFYVTDKEGTAIKRIPSMTDHKEAIDSALGETLRIYDTYASLTGENEETKKKIKFAFVVDATGDSTVETGGAFYAVTNPSDGTLTKVAETESFNEINVTGAKSWSDLTGKPSSSVTDIDDAVSKRHEHSNKDVLDKLTAPDGNLTYDGTILALQYTTVEW